MAIKIRTVMTYPLNGATVDFAIPFEYLARKFVTVTLIGQDRKVLVLNQDYRFTTKAQITTSRAWGSNEGYDTIEIRRYTSATERLVDFADGSILRAYDLNISQVQTLHVAEEARDLTADTIGVNNDGNLDARGRRIVNVANPVSDFDAVNLVSLKVWNDSAYNSMVLARGYRDETLAYRNTAGDHSANAWEFRQQTEALKNETNGFRQQTEVWKNETNGFRQQTEVWKNETNGFRQQTEALKNETNGFRADALTYRNNAADSAAKASEEATKLGNMVNLANAIADVNTTNHNVIFKGSVSASDVLQALNPNGESWFGGSARIQKNLYLRDKPVMTEGNLRDCAFAWNSSLIYPGESKDLNIFRKVGTHQNGGRYNGSIELRPMAGNDGEVSSEVAPMITFHWPGRTANALFMDGLGDLRWGDPASSVALAIKEGKAMAGGDARSGWSINPANPTVVEVWGVAVGISPNAAQGVNIRTATGLPYEPLSGGGIVITCNRNDREQVTQANSVASWINSEVFTIISGELSNQDFAWRTTVNINKPQ